MTNILVAVALTERHESLIAYALWLARHLESDTLISLLSVSDYSLSPPAYLMPYIEKEHEKSSALLSALTDKLKAVGVNSTYTFATGRLVESFKVAIDELKANFLVLGHKSHLVRQSSSEKLIKTLDIPMLVVRGKKAEQMSMDNIDVRRILCAIDFSKDSLSALELIKRLYSNRDENISLTIVNVISSIPIEGLFSLDQDAALNKKTDYYNELRRAREERLSSLKTNGIKVERICRIGVPYETINKVALQVDADIIFMGAKGLSDLDLVRIGSVTEAVIKTSPCPVMVVTYKR